MNIKKLFFGSITRKLVFGFLFMFILSSAAYFTYYKITTPEIFYSPGQTVQQGIITLDLKSIIVLIAIVLVISIAFILTFSRSIATPLKQIEDATKKLETGDFKTKVNVKGSDEIGKLGQTFNETTKALEEIEKQKQQLEKAKTEFLSITSHELRSPITPMKGQLQMLLKDYFGKLNSKQRNSVETVLRNTNRLDKILLDLLDISRIETARLKFNYKKTDLSNEINDLAKEMNYNDKKIKVKINSLKLNKIETDPDRVIQILRNLLNNAIKFSKEKSKVIIDAKQEKDKVLFSVKDSGIGISDQNKEKIFEPFFQEEQTIYRKYQGVGLGLTLCRGLVLSQGGKIWFDSQKNKGSTFYFTLPIKPLKQTQPISAIFSKE